MAENVALLRRAEPSCFDVGRRIHSVSDDVLARAGANIRTTVIVECGQRAEYCCIREYGQGAFMPVSDWQPPVPADLREWLRDLTVAFNERTAGPGMWTIGYRDSGAPQQWVAMWFDMDGDFHVTLEEANRSFERQQKHGIDAYVTQAAMALQHWAETMRNMAFSDDQLAPLALLDKN